MLCAGHGQGLAWLGWQILPSRRTANRPSHRHPALRHCVPSRLPAPPRSPALSSKLYPHQVEGVKWLWRLQEAGNGGILADDMGLGKVGLRGRALLLAEEVLS